MVSCAFNLSSIRLRSSVFYRYIPILPMVLVNGSDGIGTGWSSFVPNYNPSDIVDNLKRKIKGEEMEPMHPWYRGFRVGTESLDFRMKHSLTSAIARLSGYDRTRRQRRLQMLRYYLSHRRFDSRSHRTSNSYLDSKLQGDARIMGRWIGQATYLGQGSSPAQSPVLIRLLTFF